MARTLAPYFGAGWQGLDDNGMPLVGGKLHVYLAGTTTPTPTYTTENGVVANTNPIILDAGGRPPNEIWLTTNINYKFVLMTATDSLIRTWDNISGGVDSSTITTIDSITSLRAATVGTLSAGSIVLKNYRTGTQSPDGGGGVFFYDPLDTTSADNGGTIIVDASSRRWKRLFTGPMNVRWFGAYGNGINDDLSAILATQAAVASQDTPAIYFPAGTYMISAQIPFATAMFGDNKGVCVIKAMPSFSGTRMIDTNVGAEMKYVKNLSLDASIVAGVQHVGSSGDAQGSGQSTYENLVFIDSHPNTYSIGGSSVSAVPGMLTGCVFIRCTWYCPAWVNAGANQDDVTFIGCRFHNTGAAPTNPSMRLFGQNIKFLGSYFAIGDTNYDVFGIRFLAEVGDYTVSIENTFFESSTTNLTHLFLLSSVSAAFELRNVTMNLQVAPSFVYLFRTNSNNFATGDKYVTLDTVSRIDALTYGVLDYFVQSANVSVLRLNVRSADELAGNLYQFAGGSSGTNTSLLRLAGVWKGTQYEHTVMYPNLELIPFTSPNDSFRYFAVTTASGTSPRTTTYTLPTGGGYWQLAITAKAAGSKDHMVNGMFNTVYYDGANDSLSTQQVGTTVQSSGSSFGTLGLTAGNPNAAGQMTLSMTWTDGLSRAAEFIVKAVKLSSFNTFGL